MQKARATTIKKAAENLPGLDKYRENFRFLATGTAGVVYYGCEKKEKCMAIKVQLLDSKEKVEQFKKECKNQEAFGTMAPKVYASFTEDYAENTFGVLVMDLIGEELDKYLVKKRTNAELDNVITGITKIIKFLKKKKVTHGDLALFNIAFSQDYKKLLLIDYDVASTTIHHTAVDILRILTEWDKKTRSKGTKKMHSDNVDYIIEYGIPKWAETEAVTFVTNQERAGEWEKAYQKYCRVAKVECLPEQEKTEIVKRKLRSTATSRQVKEKKTVTKQSKEKKTVKKQSTKKVLVTEKEKKTTKKTKKAKVYPKTPRPDRKRKQSTISPKRSTKKVRRSPRLKKTN